jgi:opacity protein-like surface antigen
MSVRKFLTTSALVLIIFGAAPSKVSADWLLTPFVGMNFGGSATFNDALGDFEDEFEKRGTFGASLAWMGAGAIGFEFDFGYTPNFFETTEGDFDFDYGDNNLTTLMANIIVGAPFGGQTGGGIRPYASGGIGIMRSRITDAEDLVDDLSASDLGFNVGGGVSGFFNDRVGLRGDIRYFRQLQDDEDDDDFDLSVGDLRFWRASLGVIFRF